VSPAARFALAVALGAAAYALLVTLVAPEVRGELARFRRKRGPSGRLQPGVEPGLAPSKG
jgi:hypothetical protein